MNKKTKRLMFGTAFLAVFLAVAISLSAVEKISSTQQVELSLYEKAWISMSSVVQKNSVFSTLQPGEYYEERCMDVSEINANEPTSQAYYSRGWHLDHTDADGCEVYKHTYFSGIQFRTDSCGTYERATSEQICGNVFGSVFKPAAGDLSSGGCQYTPLLSSTGDIEWTKYGKQPCGIESYVYKGGMIKVVNTCDFDTNDLLAAETFTSGSITKQSMRYPVKGFCKAHPAVVTDNDLKQSTTSTNIYDILDSGDSFEFSDSQTVTVFYIMENNADLPTICSESESLALDVSTELCVSTLGFTYLCSEGQFDALTGTCVVQPESETICEIGRYDVQLDLCVYNPPVQYDCGGDASCFYSVDRDACVCSPGTEYQCPAGFTFYQPSSLEDCRAEGGLWDACPECPDDQVCDDSICNPVCEGEQYCLYDSPLDQVCNNANATISGGVCVVEGETVYVCPNGGSYNSGTGACEENANTVQICSDGTYPSIDPYSGDRVCYVKAVSFYDCGELAYDPITKSCITSPTYISVSRDRESFVLNNDANPKADLVCESDSDCKVLGDKFSCKEDVGVCYVESLTNAYGVPDGLFMGVVAGLVGFLGYRTAKRRKWL